MAEVGRLASGLANYYSNEAETLVSQFQHVNNLLGGTKHDWTATGTHCETLFRSFLRRHLPNSLSVDKGYVWGTRLVGSEQQHGVEVDILIHDEAVSRPLIRVDDFVVVRAAAVRAMIQVKRRLSRAAISNGTKQAANSRLHWMTMRLRERLDRHGKLSFLDDPKESLGHLLDVGDVLNPLTFTAVIGIVGSERVGDYAQSVLRDIYAQNLSQSFGEPGFNAALHALPDFVGCVSGPVVVDWAGNFKRREYCIYPDSAQAPYYNLQIFMQSMLKRISLGQQYGMPFAIPDEVHGRSNRFGVGE